jgi:hypothetical protein
MKPEQELRPQQLPLQDRPFADTCVPRLMSLARQNKRSVSLIIQDLPAPTLRSTVTTGDISNKDAYLKKAKIFRDLTPEELHEVARAAMMFSNHSR